DDWGWLAAPDPAVGRPPGFGLLGPPAGHGGSVCGTGCGGNGATGFPVELGEAGTPAGVGKGATTGREPFPVRLPGQRGSTLPGAFAELDVDALAGVPFPPAGPAKSPPPGVPFPP